jgi:outer membrane protein TolC
MIRFLILFTFTLLSISSVAQEKIVKLTLPEVIEIANRQSIDAFKNKNMYFSSYWAFKYYRASRLPSLSIASNPLSYSNSIRQDYDYTNHQYVNTQQNNITSYAALKLAQLVGATGGTFNVTSDLGMNKNFLGDKLTTYSANALSVGYSQLVNGYNSVHWSSKIEPLKFEIARKNLIQSLEDIAVSATNKFFGMIDAQIEINISNTNLANADTLYQLGKGRYQVGTVTQDELLNMELSLMNAKLAVTRANQGLLKARSDLNSYLALDKGTIVECILPFSVASLQISVDEAIQKGLENNPDMMSEAQRLLDQDNTVALTKAQNGLSVNISASAGINQKGTVVSDAYKNPSQFQNIGIVGLTVPILDWGRRKGAVLMAKSNREVVRSTIKQERIDFQQTVLMNVLEFNLQSEQVMSSARADTIAKIGYEVTMRRFKIGKLDITKLNLARVDVENARRAYITSLRKYWTDYFTIRQLTLFDFEKRSDLNVDFDKIPTE